MTTAARESLIKEALDSFDGAQDFSRFDNDGDGAIDYFVVIWSGPDNGWANFWWGYQTSFQRRRLHAGRQDAHQVFLAVGVSKPAPRIPGRSRRASSSTRPDMPWASPTTTITTTPIGPRGGVGGLDMMDGTWGDHNSFSKWVLDWLSPTVVAGGSQSLVLNPSGSTADAVLIASGATAADPFREFFIAQNRYRTGNDPASYPANGMLIWHVDATLAPAGRIISTTTRTPPTSC